MASYNRAADISTNRLVFFLDPDTGKQYRLNGVKPCGSSEQTKFCLSRKYKSKDLPPSVDLRAMMTPIENQGDVGSCVGNALAAAYEFLIMKNKNKHIDVSRLFIYYNARLKSGVYKYESAIQDDGVSITYAIDALKEYGCCKETTHPYNESKVNEKPSAQSYAEAKDFRILDGMQLQTDLDEMKACLAQGYPFVFGLELFESFSQAEDNKGAVPMPDLTTETRSKNHGWHAMLAVGYSDHSKCFIVRNSWGEDWGDSGYCYIPYDYMCNRKHCLDLHAIKTISDDRDRSAESAVSVSNDNTLEMNKKFPLRVLLYYSDGSAADRSFWNTNDAYDYLHPTISQAVATGFGRLGPSRRKHGWVIKTE